MSELAIPNVVVGVHLSTRWDKAKRRIPEYSSAKGMMLTINNVYAGRFDTTRALIYDESELPVAIDELLRLGLPIVGFNLYNYSWRVLARDFDVSSLLKLSIDVFQAVWDIVNADFLAGRGKKVSTRGQLTLTDLLFNNFDDYKPAVDIPLRASEPVALWHKFVSTGLLKVGEKPVKLNKKVGLQMIGSAPRFATAKDWARELWDQGSTLGSPLPGFRSERDTGIRPRYAPYLNL